MPPTTFEVKPRTRSKQQPGALIEAAAWLSAALLGLGGCCLTTTGEGGTSSGGTMGSACLKDKTSQPFDFCADAGECGCPSECVVDDLAWAAPNSGSQTMVCEVPCRSNEDCALIYTGCVRGTC